MNWFFFRRTHREILQATTGMIVYYPFPATPAIRKFRALPAPPRGELRDLLPAAGERETRRQRLGK
jgi:hypothetical protein